jgi:hypothetical protein
MNGDYWISVVEKLKDPGENVWAAHILSLSLGKGVEIDNTNLGEALKHVPRSEILLGAIAAYQNKLAHPYCDLILWYFEPEELVSAFKSLDNPGENIRHGIIHFLQGAEPDLAAMLMREYQKD